MKKFLIRRFKKDGSEMAPVKVKDGVWVEPDKKAKEGVIYYPGTLVPHIHLMEARKYDKFNQLKGGPMPWSKPETIWINKELLAVENIYEKLEEAKAKGDKKAIKLLSQPLVTWACPAGKGKKAVYPQGMIISNRNDKSDFVSEHIERFDKAIEKLESILEWEGVKTRRGISALINLLSAKFSFRVGNCTSKDRTGVGVTTFKPKHIRVDSKGRMHFTFRGKKKVKWHKIFNPVRAIEHEMFKGIVKLLDKKNEFVFTLDGDRIDSHEANKMFKEVLGVKSSEEDYLSFHSWRHYKASKLFKEQLDKLKLARKFKKILKSKSKVNKDLKKARLLNKAVNKIFKKVAKALNDTPAVVKSTYAGGKLFREFYIANGIKFDDKKRSFDKAQF